MSQMTGLGGLLGMIMGNDPNDFSDRYNTKLTPEEEAEFQKWERARDVYDYDARGAWKELQAGTMSEDARGHLGDKYKKPNHPTFSDQSIYHGADGYYGGHWEQDKDGNTTAFVPGIANMLSPSALRGYFLRAEPGIKLIDRRPGPGLTYNILDAMRQK